MRRIALAASVAALALGVVALGAPGSLARATKPKLVKVCGYYFAPVNVKITKGSKVSWRWKNCGTFDSHDVVLKRGPNGVKKRDFRSQIATEPFRFTKKFKKPGKYQFICSLHPTTMQMTVRVRR